MCPSATQAIDCHADDTEMFAHLQNMIDGAPTPVNVLTDVDPCKFAPWHLPESMLYFLKSDDARSLKGERGMTNKEQGYWQAAVGHPNTSTSSPNMGTKTALEFYTGHGDKTDWMMYKYTCSKSLRSCSLSKVFNLSDLSHTKDQLAVADDTDTDPAQAILLSLEGVPADTDADLVQALWESLEEVPNDTDADLVQALWESLEEVPDDADADLVQPILQNVEEEVNNSNLHNSSNRSQVLSTNNHGPSNMSGINPLNLRRDSSVQQFNEAYDFSQGDFLEINDLNDSPSSLSSSEIFCITSRNSEEYLNPEASLHEFEAPSRPEANPETNPRNVDCMLSVAATQGSRQVLIQPPASGSIGSCSNDMHTLHVEETADSATMISMHRKQGFNPSHSTASVVEERSDRIPSNRRTAAHEVSQGPSTSQDAKVNGKGDAVGGIARFKKYCCFIPFF